MQKLLTFFQKNISIYAIFNDQSFNDMLTNNIVSFEQLGPELYSLWQFYDRNNRHLNSIHYKVHLTMTAKFTSKYWGRQDWAKI